MGTAIGARNNTESEKKISFISEAHESFFYEKLSQVRYKDEYHIALVYCLGINADTRQHIDRIYDFKSGLVKPACIHEGWVTSGSARVIRMAFNLYCDGMPSVFAVRMRLSSGRRYSSGIRSMLHIIKNYMQCWEGEINYVEDQINGYTRRYCVFSAACTEHAGIQRNECF